MFLLTISWSNFKKPFLMAWSMVASLGTYLKLSSLAGLKMVPNSWMMYRINWSRNLDDVVQPPWPSNTPKKHPVRAGFDVVVSQDRHSDDFLGTVVLDGRVGRKSANVVPGDAFAPVHVVRLFKSPELVAHSLVVQKEHAFLVLSRPKPVFSEHGAGGGRKILGVQDFACLGRSFRHVAAAQRRRNTIQLVVVGVAESHIGANNDHARHESHVFPAKEPRRFLGRWRAEQASASGKVLGGNVY
ncbi:hypothetical protein CLUG_02829 [Clavispora lusitaniae ATCC 42720]|uniref:Uncharacterized protein n=1 Tax=Clavispora lusitaniae (strain ATCC 42720) TaxID=306902 RepID=C4Y2R6_CLAL4|nr:uncharacterized protein CLUG_02829 [Clavispora lusitaniae ATCC 42720]EEQ38703.1 hypothetical protein CLUG_02829 [Clavispora lusitaniae ATCC 42720]